ncbi:hypothetical protein NXY44_00025 [Phocaeicola vulgatus]|uniref:hypothetical protein n=1 Tax=Phocaeicola vulgatus TaxID=821 RepID=UPI002166B661|nr:hypothetical protein [Phocaeicola vulgatus]MCS2858562.1 hypothetical protein [Phocaeicola vulgatus]
MEKGIRKIEQNGVHVAYFTCPQIKLNAYKDATMLSLWHIKGDSMDFIFDMPELQDNSGKTWIITYYGKSHQDMKNNRIENITNLRRRKDMIILSVSVSL